jgi:hypothetical protein
MSDNDGDYELEGTYPPNQRWNAEKGGWSRHAFDSETGEQTSLIRIGTRQGWDMPTREWGYARYRVGERDVVLSPVGTPPPPRPSLEHKPCIAINVWSPLLGEMRLEVAQKTCREAITSVWESCRGAPQLAEGQVLVVELGDRVQRLYKKHPDKTYWAPLIKIIDWIPRDKTPFARRPPTVPRSANEGLILLGNRQQVEPKETIIPPKKEAPPPDDDDDLDDLLKGEIGF